ncbi:ATP-dependent RNA helicase RhlE [Alphaproteobacteria bacterium SO-S41]|nr:ATP-dependent RNA helicase RhlE [Alphaproteobacteria bacterium SO-S41]
MTQPTLTPFELLDDIRRRTAEAVIGQSGLKHPSLTKLIRERFAERDGTSGWGIIPDPLIEAAHPFVTAPETMTDLANGLLTREVVDALDGENDPRQRSYRFRRDWHPFAHQLQAWRTLMQRDPASVVVTSGTGSGKTECFLVPILDDLARQAAQTSTPLEGVQAIALYPLNALIASQEERLREWTAPFGGKIRFGLYNGDLREEMKASERRALGRPEQVMDRKALRASPPPILVTNITMLEYMLARRTDAPILAKSQGGLRWIVLDEAHTHVGAAAAEIALLLRRVLLAFNVEPQNVRFVATSATIGAGSEVERDLRRFLSDASGFPEDGIEIVVGKRRPPNLPPLGATLGKIDRADIQSIIAADADAPEIDARAFDLLASRPPVQDLVRAFGASDAVSWRRIEMASQALDLAPEPFALALARARKGDDALAPLRIHAFHRALPGLWSCINPGCEGKPDEGWAFGAVFPSHNHRCPHCRSPALEIVGCTSCGESFAEGEESQGRLAGIGRAQPKDEFADDPEREAPPRDDDDEETVADDDGSGPAVVRLFASQDIGESRPLWLKPGSDVVLDRREDGAFALRSHESGHPRRCPACGESETSGRGVVFRPYRFGAPFLLRTATPVLMEGIAPDAPDTTAEVAPPAGGRRLLSFTDSRQGTARLAAKLEIDSERDFVRSFIYHAVQRAAGGPAGAERAELQADYDALQAAIAGNPALRQPLARSVVELEARLTGTVGMPFESLVSDLAARDEVRVWIRQVWGPRADDALLDDPIRLARFLLLREIVRRPRRSNSVETIGLTKLTFGAIDRISQAPAAFQEAGLGVGDWRAFLSVITTHFARSRSAVRIDDGYRRWIQHDARPRGIVDPSRTPVSRYEIAFPTLTKGRTTRVIALLMTALGLDAADRHAKDTVDELMAAAWSALRPLLPGTTGHDHGLDFSAATLAAVGDAWLCPVTGRVLDVAFAGLTPYEVAGQPPAKASPIRLPVHPEPFMLGADAYAKVQDWLREDPEIATLRAGGVWNDIADRISLFSPYVRSVEHSAQQPAPRLRQYEDAFRKGEINILNCSTTMEMGVDIGSVATVMMTNVPPSIASYRQRVGRAGRRGQATALAFTLCKDRPLDRETFRDPAAFLRRAIAAPRVALDSRPIVQRQVNAYLLGRFLTSQDAEGLKTTIGAFFGRSALIEVANEPNSPARQFRELLSDAGFRLAHGTAVAAIVRNSVLENDDEVWSSATEKLETVEKEFCEQADLLMSQRGAARDAADRSVQFILKRLVDDFLFGALADRGFLPGHGFPRDVLAFVHPQTRETTPGQARENRFETRDYPQRGIEIAIRDYAPGAETVINGLVYRSAGVTLNWKRPADASGVRDVQSLQYAVSCRGCGTAYTKLTRPEAGCEACGSPDIAEQRFLKPGGFAADRRTSAHADVEEVSYVSPEQVKISAQGALWKTFAEAAFGRLRVSREGLAYHSNLGPERHGFAICLDCGRAAAETADRGPGDSVPKPLVDHFPLHGRGDERTGKCTGNDRSFALQRWLALGHAQTTDVFEFEPVDLAARPGALAFVAALREALARRLGIEADEMGVGIEPRRTALGAATHAVFLFDRASGGAGFSIQAETYLSGLLPEIEAILDCPVAGCVSACSACVLTRDTSDESDLPDRQPALAFTRALRANLKTPDPADLFASGAAFSFDILREMGAALFAGRAPRRADLLFNAPFDPGEVSGTPLELAARIWSQRGALVRLLLPQGSVQQLDDAARLALRDLANRMGVELGEGDARPFPNGSIPLGVVSCGDSASVWACRDAASGMAGRGWGCSETAPTVVAGVTLEIGSAKVAESALRPSPGYRFVEIRGELDVDFPRFGDTLARWIREELTKAAAWGEGPPTAMSYEDRYLCAPLQVRLLFETAAALFGRPEVSARHLLTVRTMPCRNDSGAGFNPSDWRDDQIRLRVATLAGGRLGLDVRWNTLGAVSHARILRLDFANGARSQVVFDQGFGPWRTVTPVRFDHRSAPEAQVADLMRWNALLRKSGAAATYFVAGPSKGHRNA